MRLVRRFLLVSLILFSGFAGFADSPISPEQDHFGAEPEALYSAASQPGAPSGVDVIVLTDETRYIFDREGRSVCTHYMIYKVLTQRGAEDWASMSLSWEPWHEERPVLRARVITPDHAAHALDLKTITDAPAREQESVYSDRRVIRTPLPAIAPGSVVEREDVTKENKAYFQAGTVQRVYFGRWAPVEHTRLSLRAPASLPLRYRIALLPGLTAQRSESDGEVRITFDYGHMEALDEAESNLPSDSPVYPEVAFSTGNSWQHIARDYAKVVDEQIADADLKDTVNKLVAGKQSREDKMRAILQYLDREVRYTGVEFGDAAIVPHRPTETLTHKYGDCKDKASLLVALLRAADLPAYLALLNAGQIEDVPADLPGLGMFDHAIVYAPGSPDFWIDPTDEYARLGELPASDQGRLALVARADANGLTTTTVSSSTDNTLAEMREFYLAENGPARVIETSRPRGYLESRFRMAYADKQNKDETEKLTNYVKAQYLAEKLDRLDRTDPSDISQQFELVLESKRAKRGATDLKRAVVAIRLESLFGRLPEQLQSRVSDDDAGVAVKPKKKRTADYQLSSAFVTELQYRIVPPPGFQPERLPGNSTTALGPAVLTEQFSADKDGVVQAVVRFDTVKRRFTIAEAEELRNKVAELRGGEPILLYFQLTAEALINGGKVREGFQAYRDLIALYPTEAVHHLQLAQALLDGGLGEGARQQAQLAVKLDPNSALAQKTLAHILEYDLVGRPFRPGSDLAGAELAFRAAKKLDPEEKEIVGNLAILLEHTDEGVRYGRGARLKEAIAEYRSLSWEQLGKTGLQNNLSFALFYSGDFSAARDTAQNLNPQPAALMVACEAALNGSEAGISEAHRRTASDADFGKTVATAGRMLMNIKKYMLAADLLQAGATEEGGSRVIALAAALRTAHPYDQGQYPDGPEGLVRHVINVFMEPNFSMQRIESFLSRNGLRMVRNQDPDDLNSALTAEKRARFNFVRSGVSPDVMIDIADQLAKVKAEGNDATGYRVVLQAPGTKSLVFYVIREEAKYKLLDLGDQPTAVGLEVLDRIEKQNLEAARALLDWVREDQHLGGGDDPLAGLVFPRFWTKGKDTDAEHMKLAAAALLGQSLLGTGPSLAILEPAREAASNEIDKLNISLALARTYWNSYQYQKLLSITSDLAKQYPESKSLFFSRSFALRGLARFDDAVQLAQDRLKRLPDDVDAMRTLIYVATAREDYVSARDIDQKIIDMGKADAAEFNGVAWLSLFIGKTTEADLQNAVRSAQMTQNSPGVLHTLGCLYAELGKTKEAHEVLVQAMDMSGLTEPTSSYWYAFGRIAEQFGERDIALADYARVTKPKRAIQVPESSYALAQNRLKVLNSEATSSAQAPKRAAAK